MKKLILLISLVLIVNIAYSVDINHLRRDLKNLPKNERKEFVINSSVAVVSIAGAILINPVCILAIPAKMIYDKAKENKPIKRKMSKCK